MESKYPTRHSLVLSLFIVESIERRRIDRIDMTGFHWLWKSRMFKRMSTSCLITVNYIDAEAFKDSTSRNIQRSWQSLPIIGSSTCFSSILVGSLPTTVCRSIAQTKCEHASKKNHFPPILSNIMAALPSPSVLLKVVTILTSDVINNVF